MNTIRILLSLAVNLNWCLQQFDIKNAFLHDDLKEEVFMEPPIGFKNLFSGDKVCRLEKALYALKQSPKACLGDLLKP